MLPKISVIIPVYNSELYLCECLDSVINQTLNEIEIICINDGSTDKSLNILEEYARNDKRIVLLNKKNEGPGPSRNLGINSAISEFIIFMDADDFYPNNIILEKLYTVIIENDILISGGSWSNFYTDKKIPNTVFNNTLFGYTFISNEKISYRDYQFDYGYQRFLFNRSLLIKNNIYFPAYRRFQDPPFFVKSMVTAGQFYAIPDVVYRYRKKKTKWDSKKGIDMLKGIIDNLEIAKTYEYDVLYKLTLSRVKEYFVDFKEIRDLDFFFKLLEVNNYLKKSEALESINNDFRILLYNHFFDERKKLVNKCTSLQCDKDAVLTSKSYRLGRMITWFPRKIRGFFHCLKQNGFVYTIKLIVKKIFIHNPKK
jgi:glycosyltransferase involved in cell wall biosynthesis